MKHLLPIAAAALLLAAFPAAAPADPADWIELIPKGKELKPWESDGKWTVCGDATLSDEKPKNLGVAPGEGVLVSSLSGHTMFRNLTSKQKFGDLEVHVEFLVPKGSNAGVKLEGLYEIQIKDSFGKEKITADDLGGVYPRAELKPRYHHIDEGVPPLANASKPAGQWQTLEIDFKAPRFDAEGKKIENARFTRVKLNGTLIQDDVELKWPTGHAWNKEQEVPRGPLFLQGDHGPVAFRNVKVRPLEVKK